MYIPEIKKKKEKRIETKRIIYYKMELLLCIVFFKLYPDINILDRQGNYI